MTREVKKIVFGELLIFALLSTPLLAKIIDGNKLPLRLQRISEPIPFNLNSQQYIIIDVNKDGTDELAKITNSNSATGTAPSYLLLSDWMETKLYNDQLNIKGDFIGVNFFNIWGTRYDKLVFFELYSNDILLKIYDIQEYNPELLSHFVVEDIPIPTSPSRTSFTVKPIKLLDWDKDGSPDVLCVVNTTWGYQPRGIWIINLETGHTILKKQVGPIIQNVHVYDINGDGRNEIVFSGKAAFNCEDVAAPARFVNGTDDSQSWLFILDHTGDFLLKMPIGGIASGVNTFIDDMNNDGKPEIIVFTVNGKKGENSSVAFFDLSTKNLIKMRYRPDLLNLSSEFLDWEEDGQDEFISFWSDGLLEIRDINNDVIKSIATDIIGHSTLKIIDLEQNGDKEIYLYGNSGFLLLDSHLKPLAYDSIKVLQLQSLSPGNGKKRLFQIVSPSKVAIYKLDKRIAHVFFSPLTSAITFLFGATLALAILGIISYAQKARYVPINKLPPSILFFLFSTSGKIKHIGENARQLLPRPYVDIKKLSIRDIFNSREWRPVLKIIDKNFRQRKAIYNHDVVISQNNNQRYFLLNLFPQKSAILFRENWILTLQETTELVQSKRAVAWASMAQRLAHEIKTPLSSVMLAAQQLQMKLKPEIPDNDRRIQYIEHIINQVHRLRKTTDAFMKFAHIQAPNFQPVKINEIIENCLEKIKTLIPEDIKIHKELEANLPTIWLDQDQIAIAIKNVLENAVNAIGQRGIITVTTRLVQTLQTKTHQETIVLEIADTGCGIAKDQLSHIFEPFFSQQEGGTGLGLTLVKKIIKDHNGIVSVKSQVGIGTTVYITLPIFKLS